MDVVEALNGLRADVQRLEATGNAVARKNKANSLAIIVACVALAIAVALGIILAVFVVHTFNKQGCFNNAVIARAKTTKEFLIAERDKVAGQVQGLEELKHSMGDQAAAAAGFNQFIHSSKHYLTYVNNRLDGLNENPTQAC